VMNELDACEELDVSAALGERAEVQILRSVPGKLLSSAAMEVSPASVVNGLEQYFYQSLQRHVHVQISALAYGGFIDGARGLLVECLPDGDKDAFARVSRLVEDGTVSECLEASASFRTICETLGFSDCRFFPTKPLRFFCRCSQERVEGMLAGMSKEDLQAMIVEDRPAQIFCHMCGKGYQVAVERLQAILKERT